ncbi:membrane protein [Nitrosococcus oceani]|nr:membrane protein [Nitrosococcus oceani]
MKVSRRSWYLPCLIWGLLALPPLRHALEMSMITHMLVQLPVLAFLGWWLGQTFPEKLKRRIAPWNRWGISGMILVVVTVFYWMLPRALDAAISEPLFEIAKFIGIPLFVGTALSLSWFQLNFIARGVLMLEFWAMFMRLGWLYVVLPDRLCANYLLGEQRILGRALLILGGIWAVSWTLRVLFGVKWKKPKMLASNLSLSEKNKSP